MKRKTQRKQSYLLANATSVQKEAGLFQIYQGDFFTIFVTYPVDLQLHQNLKLQYLDSNRPVHLLYVDEFIFEIFVDRAVIADYQTICPLLDTVDDLNSFVPFWSLGMEQAAKAFFNSELKGPLADRFIYARVIDLMIQLVHHIIEIHDRPEVNEITIKHAEKAKQIILDDFSVYDTVEQVARKVGISEMDLQLAFKQCFGMTVGKFSKDERMKFAHNILETTNDILLSVALAVGYNDPGNFSVAFKNYYGYSPGSIQRKKKLFNSQMGRSNSE
jgi:AraC-like DNA-binding protein